MTNGYYHLLYYAPSTLQETRLAIGLFLFGPDERLVQHRVTRNWRRVYCLDPGADPALLDHLPSHFDQLVSETVGSKPGESLSEKLRQLEQDGSNSLQISAPRGLEAADLQGEFAKLYQQYVEPPRLFRPARPLREGSRGWIYGRLRDALDRHALWERLDRDIGVEQFTAPGDAFRIDFGYTPNGATQYLHALSLERDWNQAKLLSYTFWRIREKSNARMTAVVYDAITPSSGTADAAVSCRRLLTEAQIAIQPLSGLDAFLNGVKRELRIQ